MATKTSYRGCLWNLLPLAGAACGIYDLLQEQFVESIQLISAVCVILDLLQGQFVESITSYRSSLWNLRSLTGAVCGIYELFQEQLVEYKLSRMSNMWDLRPRIEQFVESMTFYRSSLLNIISLT